MRKKLNQASVSVIIKGFCILLAFYALFINEHIKAPVKETTEVRI